MAELWVRVLEAAEIVGVDPNVIYRLRREGKVRTRRSPRGPREFHREDLERLREQCARPPATAATGGAR